MRLKSLSFSNGDNNSVKKCVSLEKNSGAYVERCPAVEKITLNLNNGAIRLHLSSTFRETK